MSGREQSPQSRQSYIGTFTACSKTWSGFSTWYFSIAS